MKCFSHWVLHRQVGVVFLCIFTSLMLVLNAQSISIRQNERIKYSLPERDCSLQFLFSFQIIWPSSFLLLSPNIPLLSFLPFLSIFSGQLLPFLLLMTPRTLPKTANYFQIVDQVNLVPHPLIENQQGCQWIETSWCFSSLVHQRQWEDLAFLDIRELKEPSEDCVERHNSSFIRGSLC